MRDLIIAYHLAADYDYAPFFGRLSKLGAEPINGNVWVLRSASCAIGWLHAQLSKLLIPKDHLLVAPISSAIWTK